MLVPMPGWLTAAHDRARALGLGRWLLRLTLVALGLSLAACGGGGEQAPGETATGRVTIDVWHSETAANLETLESLVKRFNESQDQVEVRLFYQGNDEETMAKLVVSLGSGEGPAIAELAEVDAQKMIDSGKAEPIQTFVDDESYDLADLDEKALQYYTAEDTLWSMPFSMAVPLIYYNQVVFREVGLDPQQAPRDLAELRDFAEKITKRDSSGNVTRSGLALDITGWYVDLTIAEHGDLFADNNNGRDGRATKVLFNNDTGRSFFQWWHDMVAEGLAINAGRNPTGAESFLAVGSGRAAMTFGSSAALRSVVDALEEGVEGVEIGVGSQPGVPGGTGHPGIYSRGLWVLNVRPERERAGAWTFIKWLMEPAQQAEWFAGSGYLPVSHAALDLPAAHQIVADYPLFQTALDLYLQAPATPASLGALLGPFREVREALATAIESFVSGGSDPIDALAHAEEESNSAVEDYNRRVGD
jgi:sn-glycerol 3-phosphate transport system substrate-binding protein